MNRIGLVYDPASQELLGKGMLPTFLNLRLGNPSKFEPEVAAAVKRARDALVDGISKVTRLAGDESRTEAERHHAARTVANKTNAVLTASHNIIESRANTLRTDAMTKIENAFQTSLERQAIHSELRAYIRELAGKGDIPAVRELMENYEAASVVAHSPRVLLGMAPKVHDSLYVHAVERHLPQEFAQLEQADTINVLAAKYPVAAREVNSAFYNNMLAERYTATRVEV